MHPLRPPVPSSLRPRDRRGSTVIIGADHAHVDMWSMLVIARDLLSALAAISSGVAPALDAAPEFAEHTAACPSPVPRRPR